VRITGERSSGCGNGGSELRIGKFGLSSFGEGENAFDAVGMNDRAPSGRPAGAHLTTPAGRFRKSEGAAGEAESLDSRVLASLMPISSGLALSAGKSTK